jgi:hypothetical protein
VRFVVATVMVPWGKLAYPWYLVIERTTNVSSDWKIRLGTDDKDLAQRECARLNNGEQPKEAQS